MFYIYCSDKQSCDVTKRGGVYQAVEVGEEPDKRRNGKFASTDRVLK